MLVSPADDIKSPDLKIIYKRLWLHLPRSKLDLTKEFDLTLGRSVLHTLISADKPCNVRTQPQVRRTVPLYMIERERDVEDSNNSPFHITPLVTRIVADVIKEVC